MKRQPLTSAERTGLLILSAVLLLYVCVVIIRRPGADMPSAPVSVAAGRPSAAADMADSAKADSIRVTPRNDCSVKRRPHGRRQAAGNQPKSPSGHPAGPSLDDVIN